MSEIAIRIDGLGKQYRLGKEGRGRFGYKSLRDSCVSLCRHPLQAIRGIGMLNDENSFWALKDVSFDVKRGEVVGIVGRNGAGKSTLLKILSQITKPTRGQIKLYGRVGSLLEVGTGFHPELTGRENIFLNGAILGMTRAEVKRKFDEIVAFSEIDKFLDTAVKQYSSGMYTRLAFSVAAHLEPEILVVDEVLAVGDATFQKKCLGKMKNVAGEGRTVLFVSHNMSAVMALCDRCAWLSNGSIRAVGNSDEVIRLYMREGGGDTGCATFNFGPLRHCKVESERTGLRIIAEYQTSHPIELPSLGYVVSTSQGIPIFGDNPRLSRVDRPAEKSTQGTVTAVITLPRLREGDYVVSLWFGDSSSDLGSYPEALRFSVAGQDEGGATNHAIIGPVVPNTAWQFSGN